MKSKKKLSTKELRLAWNRYRKGDHITDEELRALLKDTKKALDVLVYRQDFGVAIRVLAQDLGALEGYLNARTSKKWPWGDR